MKKKHPISKSGHAGVEIGANVITIIAPCALVWAASIKLSAGWAALLTGVVGVLTVIFVSKIHEGLHFLWWNWKEKQTAWWIYGFITADSSGAKVDVIGAFQVDDPSPTDDLVISGTSYEFETSNVGHKLKCRIEWEAKFATSALAQNDFLIVYEVTHDHTNVGYKFGCIWLCNPNQSVGYPPSLNAYITNFHKGMVQSIDQQKEFDHAFAAEIKQKFPAKDPNNEVTKFLETHAPILVEWMNQNLKPQTLAPHKK